ncbi:2-succinyl-5-enolpyruvyl-6-hydroxy-3-cyclohexene-1-carboxylic-acid synthase [Rhodospirillum sp. A1_3_36]|uniref:2-succinyl-5-enolpyruvyl-6-hydroxy-3- cyclohexene-1-carboxylic-acid synthase n=1 Tax=Rhodospirillum sp. A1_3_36 TaxID=3391666 RepID=UPI0039A66800
MGDIKSSGKDAFGLTPVHDVDCSSFPSIRAEVDNTTFRGLVQADAELNFRWAAVLIDSLVANGVAHAVMSPGAQMAPLALACRANADLTTRVVIDERSAAFHALGLARATRKPVILICTSGSAVGHWYPAVMEASAGMTPLILLTADRAPENQDRCSAQAIDQVRVFGPHTRASHHLPLPDGSIGSLPPLASRIYEQSLWPSPGPVHLNMPFRDPLVPKTRTKPVVTVPPATTRSLIRPALEDILDVAGTISGRRGVIVCGATEIDNADFPGAVHDLARATGCPIITDPLSNLRFGVPEDVHVFSRADSFLRSREFAGAFQPDWVISFGGPPTAKPVLSWLEETRATDYIVVDPSVRWADPLLRVTRLLRSDPASFCRGITARGQVKAAPADWLAAFVAAEGYIDQLVGASSEDSLWEAPIVRHLVEAVTPDSILFSGNSMSIRDFDSFSGTVSKSFRLLANRGTNGIDGSIATLLGIAAAQPGKPTLAMIGDTAFAHDIGSLQLAQGMNVTLVVLNNGGGAIFDYLPTAGIPEYEDFLAPSTMDIGLAARAAGWRHWSPTDLDGFEEALEDASGGDGPCVIEAVIDRRISVAKHKAFWRAASDIDAVFQSHGRAAIHKVLEEEGASGLLDLLADERDRIRTIAA